MRILLMTDSPFIPSGQGRLGRELAIGLAARGHTMGYIGWWHRQDIFPNLPHNIQYWWTFDTQYGANILDNIVDSFHPEVVLTIGDLWWLQYITNQKVCQNRNYFQWCEYIPVDGEPLGGGLPPSIVPVVEEVDLPVAYTNYAKNAVLKSVMDQETRNRIEVIYHGVNTNVFKPDPSVRARLRKQFEIEDQFIFLTVCRNQSRKNIPELLQAWKIFSELPETRNKVLLWPHTYFLDPMGWNIDELFDILELRNKSIRYYNQVAYAPSERHLLEEAKLAELYQIADAFILISGEGFGMPTFEAMASRLPCILLDYAASAELGAEGRAEMVSIDEGQAWTGNHNTQRPIPEIGRIVEAMKRVYLDPIHRESIAKAGHEFAVQFTWDKICDQWNDLFLRQEVPFIKPLRMEVVS